MTPASHQWRVPTSFSTSLNVTYFCQSGRNPAAVYFVCTIYIYYDTYNRKKPPPERAVSFSPHPTTTYVPMYVCMYLPPNLKVQTDHLTILEKEVQNPKTENSFPSTGGCCCPTKTRKKNSKRAVHNLTKVLFNWGFFLIYLFFFYSCHYTYTSSGLSNFFFFFHIRDFGLTRGCC